MLVLIEEETAMRINSICMLICRFIILLNTVPILCSYFHSRKLLQQQLGFTYEVKVK